MAEDYKDKHSDHIKIFAAKLHTIFPSLLSIIAEFTRGNSYHVAILLENNEHMPVKVSIKK